MSSIIVFQDLRLKSPDGFRVEIDEAHERADIILDRPPLNVVSMPQREQLRLAFELLDEDARVRVIVLRAAGEHFSSGGNIMGFMEATPETVSKLAWNIAAPARCSKPVIAANRGFCFGVGFEVSLACDFRVVSETCFYALPEQKLGQIPGSGGSARLQKIVGITRTKDIVMRSRRIPGKQAYDWGIATECVPDNRLEAATDALVDELRAFSPLAQRTAKKLLNDTEDAMLSTAIELEGHCYSRLRQSDDFKEGVEAFHAKRPAKFKGSEAIIRKEKNDDRKTQHVGKESGRGDRVHRGVRLHRRGAAISDAGDHRDHPVCRRQRQRRGEPHHARQDVEEHGPADRGGEPAGRRRQLRHAAGRARHA
jgi:2-oxoglutaroyl-CoA hydrolase